MESLSSAELREAWSALSAEERAQGVGLLESAERHELVSHLAANDVAEILDALDEPEQRAILRELPPDDVADLIQEASATQRARILARLDPRLRLEVDALLAYAEDVAGGLMNPRYARLRSDMTVAQAISYLRTQQTRNVETIYYGYVLDAEQRLVGVISFRELVMAPPQTPLSEVMRTNVVTVLDTMDQEQVSHVFASADLLCVPVVDAEGRMKGIVTADDIVDVVKEEATEDAHRMGGMEDLDAPYLRTHLLELIQKRVGWLILLLVLGFATVDLMSRYQTELLRSPELAVLGFFVPLIISCGGNSGSQAATLVVRAMALGEVGMGDWLRVVRREVIVGLGLGLLMGAVGMGATMMWDLLTHRIGGRALEAATAVAAGVLCVALWGTLAGSTLPFILRRLRADPASASAPLVATIVDASGLVIYFTVAAAVVHAF